MMLIKSRLPSLRTLPAAALMAALLPFLVVEVFSDRLYSVMDSAGYLIFHNVTEFFSVMVSLSIFGVGWFSYEQSRDRRILFLSTAFLAIGLMDFMHTLGYAGMPAFITPNSPNKSTQYWIAARAFAASAFLISAFVYPDSPGRWLSKRVLITGAVSVPLLVFAGITFFPSQLPATFVEGAGLTVFKKVSEYLIICILLLASAAYWMRISKTGDRLLMYYLAAFILSIFSELVFAVYKSVFDTFNVLGHIYKVGAFYLIYIATFESSVGNPYVKLSDAVENLQLEVDERKRAEERVIEAKEEWERTFDAITDPVMILDNSYRIVRANKATTGILGISELPAEELTCYKAVHGTDEPPAFCPHARLLADGRPHFAEIREDRLGGDFFVSVSPLHAPGGELIGSVHYIRDITERKQAEEKIRRLNEELEQKVVERTAQLTSALDESKRRSEQISALLASTRAVLEELESSEQRFRSVAQSAVDAVISIDAGGDIAFWNDSAERIFGYSNGEVFGKPLSFIVPPRFRDAHLNGLKRVAETGRSQMIGKAVELSGLRRDGSEFPLELSLSTWKTREGTFFTGIVRDITEWKLTEKAIRDLNEVLERRAAQLATANRELEAFSYSVSHDLRAPLRAISGFSEIVKEDFADKLGDEGLRMLNIICDNTQKMGRLIDDLLSFSRMSRQGMNLVPLDMSRLARDTFDELQPPSSDRRIQFILKDMPAANGDPSMMRQVFTNLISNAIKFTRSRETATIEVGGRTAGNENIYYVKDNGVGFDMKYENKLFGVFQRLHSTGEFEGTGVGLALVQRIIQRNGGRVWAEGKVNEGATLYFALPCRELAVQ